MGIVILPDLWAKAKELWRRVEEYAFDYAWTYDHLGWRDTLDQPWFDAVATLTAAATVTTGIRIGPLVASATFRHPVHLAREVTALDDISGGRLTLGLGAGGVGFDTTVLGGTELPSGAKVDRFTEFVTLLDRLLCHDRTSWRGAYFAAVDARSAPGCVQRPRAPFVLAANEPRSMRLVARFGQGWVTPGKRGGDLAAWWKTVRDASRQFEDVASAAGRDPSTINRHLYLDSAPLFSLSSVAYFAEATGRASELGYTDVITHWPRPAGWYAGAEAVLEAVAADVLPALASPLR